MEIDFGRYHVYGRNRALDYMSRFKPVTVMKEIGQESLEDFARGAGVISKLIEYENPDYIIAPARGAMPLIWSLEEIAKREGRELPNIVKLPTGTHTDIYDADRAGGINKPQKWAVIKDYLQTICELESGNQKTKILLLDEARYGGTVTNAAEYIYKGLEELRETNGWRTELVTIVAHDKRNSEAARAKRFNRLMSNQYGPAHKVTMDMPYIDRNHILPLILSQNPSVRDKEAKYEAHELMEFVENDKARELCQKITGHTLDGIENWEYDCKCAAENIINGKQ